MIGALAIGLLIGMIIELFIDAETIRELQRKNEVLELKLKGEERQPPRVIEAETNAYKPVEVIEIVDRRTPNTDDIKFGGF